MAETLLWIDPDGAEMLLDVDWSVSGRFSPPAVWDEQGAPGMPGMRLWEVRHGVAEFTLRFWIDGLDEADLRDKLRAAVRALNPTRGTGRVRVVAPGGDSREIYCRAADGLGVEEVLGGDAGIISQRLTVKFRAHDPYWWATTDTVLTYSGGGTVASFFPFFPIALTASEVLVLDDVTNDGDVDVWPVWPLTGPFTDVVAENLTTGKSWSLTSTVVNPDYVTVDTRPGAKTVTAADGTSLFSALSSTSQLWPLVPGVNSIRVAIGGQTAATSAQMLFRPRYLSP